MQTKFHKYYVTNGVVRARVHYSPHVMRSTGKRCITLYEKGYGNDLPKIFRGVENDTDIMTDYFDDNKYRIAEDDPRYQPLLDQLKSWGFAQ